MAGSAIYKALALSGAGRTTVERGPGGYGRKKRQSESVAEVETEVEPATGECFFHTICNFITYPAKSYIFSI